METDDRSSPHSPGRATGAEYASTDELNEATERLESFSWDEPRPRSRVDDEEGDGEGVGMIHGFLEDQLRLRPLPTLLAAVAAGWVVGKLLR